MDPTSLEKHDELSVPTEQVLTTALFGTPSQLRDFALPRYDHLPAFGFYVDQLVSYVNGIVSPLAVPDEKPLTPAMVNNYVKQGAMPRPLKKKYNANHIANLIVICILKKVFSIQEIIKLIQVQKSLYDSGPAYDAFAESLEKCISLLLEDATYMNLEVINSDSKLLIQRGVSTFTNKLFIQMMLQ